MQNKEKFDLDAGLKKCKTMENLTGKNSLVQKLISEMIEKMLAQKMAEHLGYEKYDKKRYLSGNSRNGTGNKHV